MDRLTNSSSVTLLPYTSVPLTKSGGGTVAGVSPSSGPPSGSNATVAAAAAAEERVAEAVTEGEITKRIDDIGRWVGVESEPRTIQGFG